MPRKRNPGVVYAGLVGAKMKPVSHRTPRTPVRHVSLRALDGPFAGQILSLDSSGDLATLPFSVGGSPIGRYVRSRAGSTQMLRWQPVAG
jgi:hypothetical protein